MGLEWARLKPQPTLDLADDGVFLSGEGRCRVLLLHGLTGSPAELGFLAHWLRGRARYHVSCPRLANHGQPLAILARTTWLQLYDSARSALIRASRSARAEGVPLIVGGLSAGALLSLLLAAEFSSDVAGVVCLAPTFFYDGWSVPWYHRLIPLADHTPLKNFAFFREDEPYGLRDESLRAKIAARYQHAKLGESSDAATYGYAHFPVRLFCEMRRLIRACDRSLPAVTCPVLVVQAEHDDITGPRNAKHLLRRVGSKRRELLMLERSYHLVSVDLEQVTVARRMQQFCLSLAEQANAPVAA